MQINMNAILSLANVKDDDDPEFAGLDNSFQLLPEHLAQAVQEEIARTKADATRQAATEIVKLIQAVQNGISTSVANLKEARRKERAELKYIRDLKNRLDFANESSNYLVLSEALRLPLNSVVLREAAVLAETNFQTWLAKRNLNGGKTKKTVPTK